MKFGPTNRKFGIGPIIGYRFHEPSSAGYDMRELRCLIIARWQYASRADVISALLTRFNDIPIGVTYMLIA